MPQLGKPAITSRASKGLERYLSCVDFEHILLLAEKKGCKMADKQSRKGTTFAATRSGAVLENTVYYTKYSTVNRP